jgi:C4-dicarboxylate transporter, DctQ subunit
MAADQESAAPADAPTRGFFPIRWWEWFEDNIILNLGALLLGAAMLLMLFEAISRSVAGNSYDYVEELVRYAVVWSFFLCLAVSARHGFHIRADVLRDKLPPRLRHLCDVISAICGILFAGFLLYAGVLQTRQLLRNGMLTESSLDWPIWAIQVVLPIGAAMMLVFYLGALWRGARGLPVFAKQVEIE